MKIKNRTLLLPLAAVLCVAALTGCTRTSYAIQTNDARTIISDGKPKEADSGLLEYTDANGVKQQISKTEVKQVTELPK
ncbi:YgdI/YgdR family lipoprotein [Rahnella woolbedingensis]|uniref:YgdI/YgdR family lipoprotein n=1 Tax=Rahnella woolbedingensis TaxID=1510574 RepID=A0A419N919_9GAMM|nr:YgdI/YgdR family lipoprotein [Rahnella woolbedingensis]RJT44090.1 YgdI/YgdR family lipoprotein [Rahnella woolbedingensis]